MVTHFQEVVFDLTGEFDRVALYHDAEGVLVHRRVDTRLDPANRENKDAEDHDGCDIVDHGCHS